MAEIEQIEVLKSEKWSSRKRDGIKITQGRKLSKIYGYKNLRNYLRNNLIEVLYI